MQLRGREAEVTIPSLSAVVARIEPPEGEWSLRRDEAKQGEAPRWLFHAVFSYVNPLLFNDDRFTKRFTVRISRTKQYRLEFPEGQMVLQGRSLLSKGVTLWPVD